MLNDGNYLEHNKSCINCHLSQTRRYIVKGDGSLSARIMILGDRPGAQENNKGLAFVGETGILLRSYLKKVGLTLKEVYLDNVVSCWPFIETEKGLQTREASSEEINACIQHIHAAIYQIDPLLIIAMGKTALASLTNVRSPVSQTQGELYWAEVPGFYTKVRYPVLSTYHPAHLLRLRGTLEGASLPRYKQREVGAREAFTRDLVAARDTVRKLGLLYKKYPLRSGNEKEK